MVFILLTEFKFVITFFINLL